MKHVESKRPALRRPQDRLRARSRAGAVLGRAAVAGGLVAAGAAFGVLVSLPGSGPADAGEQNYVKSSSHEAISNVRLDEEISILFSASLYAPSVGPDTILVRTGPTQGEQARGSYVVGRFLGDRRSQRRVVVRPEAIQEYYQLIQGLSREDASRQAARLIQRIETTGKFGLLDKLDRELNTYFGESYGAGTRLDDSGVFSTYPPPLNSGDPLSPYRERIAGDDVLWQQYFVNADFNAFAQLQQNSEYERFYHRIDPATGVAESASVLRGRKYRRVLVDRRSANRVMFVPEVPIRADFTDTGYKIGSPYSVIIPAKQPNVYNTVLTRNGHRPLLQSRGRDFSTYFTTMPGSVTSTGLFLDGEARTGLATLQKPRVICQTPPAGETFVDSTTDWEDPDNQGTTPVSARRTFTVRLRFAQPIDPRSVTPANFTIRKTKVNPDSPGEISVDIPVAVGTFLSQSRFGNVEVEVTPAANLDPGGKYEITVKGLVKSLGGELLNLDYRKEFTTGAAPPPLDAIRETFLTPGNQADPRDADTLDQQTTAFWPAPARFDPQGTGRAVAKFMPFMGTGLGAPRNPTDRNSEIVTNLALEPGEVLQFVTEDQDPASTNFGKQLEYNYLSFSATAATITAIGRYPLVIRSQTDITLTGTNVLVNGSAGGEGLMNTDTLTGSPPGGLGGQPGVGGYRGGDGGAAALTDSNFQVILDGQGRLQFDAAKTFGLDGQPGYRGTSGDLVGGGRGGFSGDNDFPAYDADGSGGPPNADDNPVIVERRREAGGGGGHGTDGGDGGGARGTLEADANGDAGGLGGGTYGDVDFSTAPVNALGVPTLAYGFGGAGGGGGGMEDDDPIDVAGPEDAGGGGGGGGGGAIQLCARGTVVIDSTTIDARGGAGGRTFNANRSSTGQGAPGGCGAGGAIWLQAYEGEVVVQNGARVWANGGDNTNSVGELTTSRNDTPSSPSPIIGKGGNGGDGYVRIEDATGVTSGEVTNLTSGSTPLVRGLLSTSQFRPQLDGTYPGRTDDVLMVVDQSVIYSRWFNTLLDTPTFVPQPDDPLTPSVDGTLFNAYTPESGGTILIECRSAPNDPNNTGHPSGQPTAWVPYDQVGTISIRRYIQFRATFTLPLTFTSDQPLPYIEFLQVNIELQ